MCIRDSTRPSYHGRVTLSSYAAGARRPRPCLLYTSPSPRDRQSLHKLRTFHEACTDTRAQNEAGAAPLLELLHELSLELRAPNATTAAVAWLHARGFPVLFDAIIDGDPGRAPHAATPRIVPSGLGLRAPAAYDDAATRTWYEALVLSLIHI